MIASRAGQDRALQGRLVHGKQVGVVRWVELIEEERVEAVAKVAQHAAPLLGCGRDQAMAARVVAGRIEVRVAAGVQAERWSRGFGRRQVRGFGGRCGNREAVVVGADGVGDSFTPAVRAKGIDVLVLGDAKNLGEGLGEASDGAGGARFDGAASDGGDEVSEG